MPHDSRDLYFTVVDSDGATTRDLSPYLSSVDGLPGEYPLTEVTDVGDSGHRWVKGRSAGEFHLSGLYEKTATSGLDTVMANLLGMSTPTAITYGPTGSTLLLLVPPNRLMTGSAFIRDYRVLGQVGSAVAFEAAGVVTVGAKAGGLSGGLTFFTGTAYSTEAGGIPGPYSVYLTTVYKGAIGQGNTVDVQWTAEEWDTADMSPSSHYSGDRSKVLLPVAGSYNVTAAVQMGLGPGSATQVADMKLIFTDSDNNTIASGTIYTLSTSPGSPIQTVSLYYLMTTTAAVRSIQLRAQGTGERAGGWGSFYGTSTAAASWLVTKTT